MRLGVVLDTLREEALLEGLAAQATAAETAGLAVAWLEEGPRTGPPLITAAALGARTSVLRLVACVTAGEHPLAIAEAASVADNCTNGRLILAVAGDDPELLGETADALLAATADRPFRHAGRRWTIPANRPENDGARERITVTPATVQLELPVWLLGAGAAAAGRGLPVVAAGGEGPRDRRGRTRPGMYELDVDADGSFDADALVERLIADQDAAGRDLAVMRLPDALEDAARLRAIARLASHVKPRVIEVPLPDGLEAYWEANPALLEGTGRS